MNNGSTVVSYTLAALAGLCFVTGVALLSNEGSVIDHGPREENYSNA
jgi:hypothetical protein